MRILVVEDEPRLASFLANGLRENGYAVDIAADGEEGMHLGRSGIYDVILLDILLPRQSGFEVLRQLRANSCHGQQCLQRLRLRAWLAQA